MRTKLFSIAALCVIAIVACKSKQGDSGSSQISAGDLKQSVCVWDKAALKDSPTAQGKWLASVNRGEKFKYLGDTQDDNSGSKPVTYHKIQLQDGKEGWIQGDFVVLKGKAAAIVQDAVIYSRPDLLTKTDKSFSKFDIVAIKAVQDDFIEVVGKRKDGKWIESGWIKPAGVTIADIDVAVASLTLRAMAITDEDKRDEALLDIINNTDLASSIFIEELKRIASHQPEFDLDAELEGDSVEV